MENHISIQGQQLTTPCSSRRFFTLTPQLDHIPELITSKTSFTGASHAQGLLAQILLAFTHWTKQKLNHKALICGFVGVGHLITDSVIYDVWYVDCFLTEQFSCSFTEVVLRHVVFLLDYCQSNNWHTGNHRQKGLDVFDREHICNRFCDMVALPKREAQTT